MRERGLLIGLWLETSPCLYLLRPSALPSWRCLPFPRRRRRPPDVKATNPGAEGRPAGAPAGGCYVTLTASSDDRLVAVGTPAADHAEIHTSRWKVTSCVCVGCPTDWSCRPARPVALKPGAEHLMIIGPKAQRAPAAIIPITLKFAKAKPVSLEVPHPQRPDRGLSAQARGEH